MEGGCRADDQVRRVSERQRILDARLGLSEARLWVPGKPCQAPWPGAYIASLWVAEETRVHEKKRRSKCLRLVVQNSPPSVQRDLLATVNLGGFHRAAVCVHAAETKAYGCLDNADDARQGPPLRWNFLRPRRVFPQCAMKTILTAVAAVV